MSGTSSPRVARAKAKNKMTVAIWSRQVRLPVRQARHACRARFRGELITATIGADGLAVPLSGDPRVLCGAFRMAPTGLRACRIHPVFSLPLAQPNQEKFRGRFGPDGHFPWSRRGACSARLFHTMVDLGHSTDIGHSIGVRTAVPRRVFVLVGRNQACARGRFHQPTDRGAVHRARRDHLDPDRAPSVAAARRLHQSSLAHACASPRSTRILISPDSTRSIGRSFQNLMMDLFIPTLERVMNVYLAGQIYTITSFVLILSGTLALNRQLYGHWSVLPMIAFPLLYNNVFLVGTMNYVFGIGLSLWALAAWIWLRERGVLLRLAVSTVFVLGLFFCHLFSVGLYGLGVLSFELLRVWEQYPRRPRKFFSDVVSNRPLSLLVDFVVSGLPFLPVVPLLLLSPTWGCAARFSGNSTASSTDSSTSSKSIPTSPPSCSQAWSLSPPAGASRHRALRVPFPGMGAARGRQHRLSGDAPRDLRHIHGGSAIADLARFHGDCLRASQSAP